MNPNKEDRWLLSNYQAWKLSKHEQTWSDHEEPVDVYYVCQVSDGDKWSEKEYGRTIELAIARAIVSLESKKTP